MAKALRIPWFAVHVETPEARRMSEPEKARVAGHLRMAQRLGAEVAVKAGERTADAMLAFARDHGVTQIIVGKPRTLTLRERLKGSFVDELIRGSGGIDVYATAGEGEAAPAPSPVRRREFEPAWAYALSAGISAVAALLGGMLFGTESLADVVMLQLLGVVIVSLRLGYGPSLLAALLSALAFDFFFVPPYLSFAITDFGHVVTFAMNFVVAIVISHLARRVRDQADAARDRERRTALLYDFSRELARTPGREALVASAAAELRKVFSAEVAVYAGGASGRLDLLHRTLSGSPSEDEPAIARWVWTHLKDAGAGTDSLPGTPGLYVPLVAARGPVGVLGLVPADPVRFRDVEQRRLLDALATQMALAMERARLVEETHQARVEAEREHLRNTLLGSVSHDLRTPLASITGAASTLVTDAESLDAETRRELATSIVDEADRLNRRVRDLLDMTRLQSNAVRLHKEWQPVEEVVGAALARMERALAGREVHTRIPSDLPLVPFDAVLIEQVLVNLLENAVKYSPAGTAIEIRAASGPGEVIVTIADQGPGIPPGQEQRVFEKFYQAADPGRTGGVGLGLAVCRAALDAHGGRIWVENLAEGGAAFRFALPVQGTPPTLDPGGACEEGES
jgi:two-component system sensor histidine kinase KdpD